MGLLGKLFLGRAAAGVAGKGVKKVEKKVKKDIKRTKRTIALMTLSFLCGAGLMGVFIYEHRRVLAAAVSGTRMPMRHHRFCLCRRARRR